MSFSTLSAPFTRSEYPDEFLVVRTPVYAASDLNNTKVAFAVLDRDCDVISIVCHASAWSATDKDITFYKAASGTAIGSGTALGAGATVSGPAANTSYSYDLTTANCQALAAGTILGVGGESGLADLANFIATIRLRTHRYRTVGGNKVFNLDG